MPQVENEVGLEILMLPIDACADEQFEGGCFNYRNITGRPAMVNANGTSFVGVEVFIVATAGCRALAFPDPNNCTGDYCYHGGTCVTSDWGVLASVAFFFFLKKKPKKNFVLPVTLLRNSCAESPFVVNRVRTVACCDGVVF